MNEKLESELTALILENVHTIKGNLLMLDWVASEHMEKAVGFVIESFDDLSSQIERILIEKE